MAGVLVLSAAAVVTVSHDGPPEDGVPVRPSSQDSGLPWASGGSDDRGIAAFEQWRGRRADVRVMWNSADTWANAEATYGLREAAQENESHLVSYALPLLTREDGQSLGSCAAGGNDEHFRVMAHNIVENGFGSAVVRPGWEGSADWYAWGVTNPRNGDTQQAQRAYRECFRRLAGIFREVAPDVIIELDYGTAGGLTNIADVYPGDDFVDVIGNDVYLPSTIRDAQDWNRFCRSGTARRPVGLCRYAEFAREHHKLFAVAEWGLDTTNAPDADAVAYVEGMARLFRDQRDILAYEAYYNRTDDPSSPCEFRLDGGCNPEAAATYLRLFGAAGSTG